MGKSVEVVEVVGQQVVRQVVMDYEPEVIHQEGQGVLQLVVEFQSLCQSILGYYLVHEVFYEAYDVLGGQ